MADQHTNPSIAALRKLEKCLHLDQLERDARSRGDQREHARPHDRERDVSSVLRLGPTYWRVQLWEWWLRLRKMTYVAGALAGLVLIAMLALWWRLGSGPIDLDVATPWLTAAIEENFGSRHQIEVGGTQLERDEQGRTALRIRDIVVRDPDGAVVASAPKAEVGVSSAGLITGRVRAERLSLVGAEMQVRIEPDSKVTVFAGANKRPFVTASASSVPIRAGMLLGPSLERLAPALPAAAPTGRNAVPEFAALVA